MDLEALEIGPVSGPAEPVTAVDPNVLLSRLRDLSKEVMECLDDPELADDVSGGEAGLATAFLQLDDWLSRRGFLPAAWQDTAE